MALKGSDGVALQNRARQRGAEAKAAQRCQVFLEHLANMTPSPLAQIQWLTPAAPMGRQCFDKLAHEFAGGDVDILPLSLSAPTSAAETRAAADKMLQLDVDLLIFVGGDGTAREILTSVGESLPVLGIPAGVKMHSGVFAVSPKSAALLIQQLVVGGKVAPVLRQVRDYDETSPAGEMRVVTYGELCVPESGGYLQHTKVGGKESEPQAVQEITAQLLDNVLAPLQGNRDIVLGPGSTCLAIKQALGLDGTLRGCDVLLANKAVMLDTTAQDLETLHNPFLVVSFTRSQGFLFGRGNQQISAAFLRKLQWPRDVCVVASRTKLASLEQRPLLVDTQDEELDAQLCGLVQVCTGYEDYLLYRVWGQS